MRTSPELSIVTVRPVAAAVLGPEPVGRLSGAGLETTFVFGWWWGEEDVHAVASSPALTRAAAAVRTGRRISRGPPRRPAATAGWRRRGHRSAPRRVRPRSAPHPTGRRRARRGAATRRGA